MRERLIDLLSENQKNRVKEYIGLKIETNDDILEEVMNESDDENFIKTLYFSLLKRPKNKIELDVNGIQSWIGQINMLRLPRFNVINYFKNENEYRKAELTEL